MANKDNETLLTFPCEFDIKVMGRSGLDFEGLVLTIIRKHVPKLGEAAVKIRYSKKSNYTSMTITIMAESKQQLDNIYLELNAQHDVLMTL